MPSVTLYLKPVPPFRLDLTVWVLKRRPEYIADAWDGEVYRRALHAGAHMVGVAIRQVAPPECPVLEITLSGAEDVISRPADVVATIERLLGTSVDLSRFYSMAESDERLRELVDSFKGSKPTRYPSMFECLTNAITCQLLSLNVGLRVVSRLVDHYAERSGELSEFPPAFPMPATIAGADPDHLREIGFSRQKARALIELAQGIASGSIDLAPLAAAEDSLAVEQLVALRGVGRWTAEYALLRGLGRLHVFPGDDVGARNMLQRWTASTQPLTYSGVKEALSGWEPYGGMIYFHMLLLGIETKTR